MDFLTDEAVVDARRYVCIVIEENETDDQRGFATYYGLHSAISEMLTTSAHWYALSPGTVDDMDYDTISEVMDEAAEEIIESMFVDGEIVIRDKPHVYYNGRTVDAIEIAPQFDWYEKYGDEPNANDDDEEEEERDDDVGDRGAASA